LKVILSFDMNCSKLKHLYLTYIVGGLYHDDGYVKHGLPTAAAATMMLWGLVDYKKAYDSVPHSWILRGLKIFHIADNIPAKP